MVDPVGEGTALSSAQEVTGNRTLTTDRQGLQRVLLEITLLWLVVLLSIRAVVTLQESLGLHEALLAAEQLKEREFGLCVVNMPWLNRIDAQWLQEVVKERSAIYVLEDHAPIGGLGDRILETLVASGLRDVKCFAKLAVDRYPAWGTPSEVLQYHKLDGISLASRILRDRVAK